MFSVHKSEKEEQQDNRDLLLKFFLLAAATVAICGTVYGMNVKSEYAEIQQEYTELKQEHTELQQEYIELYEEYKKAESSTKSKIGTVEIVDGQMKLKENTESADKDTPVENVDDQEVEFSKLDGIDYRYTYENKDYIEDVYKLEFNKLRAVYNSDNADTWDFYSIEEAKPFGSKVFEIFGIVTGMQILAEDEAIVNLMVTEELSDGIYTYHTIQVYIMDEENVEKLSGKTKYYPLAVNGYINEVEYEESLKQLDIMLTSAHIDEDYLIRIAEEYWNEHELH